LEADLKMNLDEIYKLLEQREEKIIKNLTMELEKATEKITANLRLLLAENDKHTNERIGEMSEKVNNLIYRCDEFERNCNKCENSMHTFRRDFTQRVEDIEKTANRATGMGILMKIILGSGLIGLIFAAGQMFPKSTNHINNSVPTHLEK
jgi:predicted nuclease with TOPRIM domain